MRLGIKVRNHNGVTDRAVCKMRPGGYSIGPCWPGLTSEI